MFPHDGRVTNDINVSRPCRRGTEPHAAPGDPGWSGPGTAPPLRRHASAPHVVDAITRRSGAAWRRRARRGAGVAASPGAGSPPETAARAGNVAPIERIGRPEPWPYASRGGRDTPRRPGRRPSPSRRSERRGGPRGGPGREPRGIGGGSAVEPGRRAGEAGRTASVAVDDAGRGRRSVPGSSDESSGEGADADGGRGRRRGGRRRHDGVAGDQQGDGERRGQQEAGDDAAPGESTRSERRGGRVRCALSDSIEHR